ncbi:hypothetical protein PQR62_03885 [Herbaspirillum lusitanum]|uniref:Fimbrial protein n=1 Tax=Herbaspirillum lusitanum TaxID=213312 RepID=A0ABW9A3Z3_9BURK
MQISFDDIRPHAGSQFSSSVEGVEISLTHKGKQITPGDSVSYAFHGKQDTSVPMMAALQRTAGSNAADAVPSKVRGAILVSFNYR